MQKKTVLFVDDEERVLSCLKGGLLGEPYKTLFAKSGEEALEILSHNEVHVIVTDMRMPEMGGLDLLRIVKKDYPRIVRMVLSGYTQVTTLLTAINQGEIFRFITKPWDFEKDFKPAIREAIEYYDSQNQGNGGAEESEQHKDKQPEKVMETSE